MQQTHFRAPWDGRLKTLTAIFSAVCVGGMVLTGTPGSLIFLAILVGSAVFGVRGYTVREGELLIHRLGWSTRFDLAELSVANFSPGATMGSVRTFGIGGLFGYVGRFRNTVLGSYIAYATNSSNTVVLEFDRKTVVVTPDRPSEFVAVVKGRAEAKRS